MIVGLLCASCVTIFPSLGTSPTSVWWFVGRRFTGYRFLVPIQNIVLQVELRNLISFPLFTVIALPFMPMTACVCGSYAGLTCYPHSVSKERGHQFGSISVLCVCVISISFHLLFLSLVSFTDWFMAFSFFGDNLFRQFSSYLKLSAEHKLVWTLSRHRMGCGTIVADRPLNLLFKCFPFNLSNSCTLFDCLHETFDVTACLRPPRCDLCVPGPLFLGIFCKFGPIKRGVVIGLHLFWDSIPS